MVKTLTTYGDESNFADLEEDRILSRRFDQASYINIVYLYCILILFKYVFKYLRFTAGH